MPEYPPFAVTADLVVFTIRDGELCVLVICRGEEPFAGSWALPGGFVRPGENLDEAAERELIEETSLGGAVAHLEQLGSYGGPDRDPRMRVVTVAYLALVPELPVPVAGGDASDASWRPVRELKPDSLAFDHARILADGLDRARAKLEYSPLAAAFCQPEFTVADLRRVYEIVWDTELDPRNFHRKVTSVPGFLEPTGGTTAGERGRPALLFRRGEATLLHPAMLRPVR
ncbi:MAG: hydrolase [Actinomycetia bacterium]|jgi:8-oxo-dGTP diphosphatase|nr:hydrolase [Actinomycetes bacterium]MDQ1657207.1 8-oxo-dGTP diphosphatase [Cryptosporangiaceae bacterium]